ncbi:MAG: hypothetical protein AB1657_03100 [Candidatus Micrarchaeota archaeon]
MDENGSGAGRPKMPPPPGQRQAARPPPPPAARKATLTGMPACEPLPSAQKPAPEQPAKNTFREILGEPAYSKMVAALRMMCGSCGIQMSEFQRQGDSLLFRGQRIAAVEDGGIKIPLAAFGDENKVYARLYSLIESGALPAGALAGLPALPPGLFIQVTAAGFGLTYNPGLQAAPQSALSDRMLLNVCKVLGLIQETDADYKGIISVKGDTVVVSSGGVLREIASGTNEMRIYFNALGWNEEPVGTPNSNGAIRFEGLAGQGGAEGKGGKQDAKKNLETKKSAFTREVLKRCGGWGTSSGGGAIHFTVARHVFFLITEREVSFCASNRQDGQPSIYLTLQL